VTFHDRRKEPFHSVADSLVRRWCGDGDAFALGGEMTINL